jgi:hypothetical protein
VSFVLDSIPMYAVMVDDVGQRGAHRVAYLDYLAVSQAPVAPSASAPASVTVPNASSGSFLTPNLTFSVVVSMGLFALGNYLH